MLEYSDTCGHFLPEDEFHLARSIYETGDLPHAAHHLGNALVSDPDRAEWLDLLDRMIDEAPDPLELAPVDEKSISYVTGAVRGYVLHRLGRLDEALDFVLGAAAARPDVPFLRWAIRWIEDPAVASTIDPGAPARYLGTLVQRHPGDYVEDDDARAVLAESVALVEPLLAAGHGRREPILLFAGAAILRKVGMVDRALEVAGEGFERAPGYHTALALAYANSSAGNQERAIELFERTLEFDPEDVGIRLDIGDRLLGLGRFAEAATWYEQALAREPRHPWALPSFFLARYQDSDDPRWRTRLRDYVRAEPANARAASVLRSITPYVGYIPSPQDACINLCAKIVDEGAKIEGDSEVSLTVSCLESPSAIRAFEMQLSTDGNEIRLTPNVQSIPTPDTRLPKAEVAHLLWRYDGTNPVEAVAPPRDDVRAALAEIAGTWYDLDVWRERAREVGRRLGPARVGDLLGAMVHPGRPESGMPAWYWFQRMQVAAALALSGVDSGWEASMRRKVLVDLALGPMDWSVDAALLALGEIARESEEASHELEGVLSFLLGQRPDRGAWYNERSIIATVQRLPTVTPDVRAQFEEIEEMLDRRDEPLTDEQIKERLRAEEAAAPRPKSPGVFGKLKGIFRR